MSPKVSRNENELRTQFAFDLPAYAIGCLQIRTKRGSVEPFLLNMVQRELHKRLEAQKDKIGKVRAIVLKGRQMGCSTYVAARFYHRTTHANGTRCYILTHSDQATANLFDIVDRMHSHCPDPFRPTTGAANAKELTFAKLDSGYRVGTAGTKDVGRSATLQLLHGSEVAFWPNAETHAAGIFQAVPDLAGSEIILESTANGFGNLFHSMWEDALCRLGGYQPIFLPWFWHTEYARPVPPGFRMSQDDAQYQLGYELSREQ